MSTNVNEKSDEEVRENFAFIFFVKEGDELIMSHNIYDRDGLVDLPDAIRRHKTRGELFTTSLKTLWGRTTKIDDFRMSGVTFDVVVRTSEMNQDQD